MKQVAAISQQPPKPFHLLTDTRVGIVTDLYETSYVPNHFGLFFCSAKVAHTDYHWVGYARNGTGVALRREEAARKALGEAIEAYSVAIHWGMTEFIQAPYAAIQQQALDPQAMSLLSPDELTRMESDTLSLFDPQTPLLWTWGTCLNTEEAQLVPVSMVYLIDPALFDARKIWEPSSSGLACGISYEAATLSGLLEVVERDAFLMAWWNQLPCPRVSPSLVASDPRLHILLEHLERRHLTLMVNDLTVEYGIPTYCAWIVDPSGHLPAAAVGAAAHLTPRQAILKAIVECCHTYQYLHSLLVDSQAPPSFGPHHEDIRQFDEHALLYSRPDMLPMLDFFGQGSEQKQLPADQSSRGEDSDLRTCLRLLESAQMQVYTVDITAPEVRACGLHVVRVLVTGAQHMVGSGKIRLLANPRLFQIPRVLGYTDRDTLPESLNPLPHPFP